MDRRNFLALSGVAAMASTGTIAQNRASEGTKKAPVPAGAAESDKLLMRKIPYSGEMLPAVGLGTSGPFEVGESERDRAPLREVLAAFFGKGATLIDTSPMYSTAESVLG